jgi:GMP synthase-like glutamine amidotransferase
MHADRTLKVAVLDMYNNAPNLGMKRILANLEAASTMEGVCPVEFKVFETRYKDELPDLSFDLYISSGGPGSPFDMLPWEDHLFQFFDDLYAYNQNHPEEGKYFFGICHSFQLICRHFQLGEVIKRRSKSFGVMPVHKTDEGRAEPLFEPLGDPFFVADFREWQVVRPNAERLAELDGKVLLLEKYRPHVPLERAMTAVRLAKYFVGVQFHPEADAKSLKNFFSTDSERESITKHHGEEKYAQIMALLDDPTALALTEKVVFPNFLREVSRNFCERVEVM